MEEYKDWQASAVALNKVGVMSWREIAKVLKVSKSTVSDFLRSYTNVAQMPEEHVEDVAPALNLLTIYNIATDKTKQNGTHLFISDCQVKPGIDLSYLEWLGEYIVRKKPDVIINAGDFADMPSLSSWDKGKRSSEGSRVSEDIDAVIRGMNVLLKPLHRLQQRQLAEHGEITYKPRLLLTLGNHEDRINRYVNNTPELHGFLSIDDLRYEDFGWEVVPFLRPVVVGGISYCHYYPNVMTGRALTGTAANMLKTIGKSFSMGHRQVLDTAVRFLPTGEQQWALISGAYYGHQEAYKGEIGNHHWRGVVLKHGVKDGAYDPLFISLEWLKKEYGGKRKKEKYGN